MVAIDWLLQAGFRIRGVTESLAIDPYLSNVCEQIYGLRRRTDPPVRVDQLDVNAVCISHWHEDHLDMPTVLELMRLGAVIVAPASCLARIEGRGGSPERLLAISVGQTRQVGETLITATPAIHAVPGYLTEDAVGYVVTIDGVRFYHSGDTEYDRTLLTAGVDCLDVALLCINGTGGNMNPVEAAALTAQLRPRVVVPMHFGLWTDEGDGPGATTDPGTFVELCSSLAPATRVVVADPRVPFEVVAGDLR